MILIPHAVFILFTLGVLVAGLVAGYAVGSSGPCPNCDAIETVPETRDGEPYSRGKDGWWRRG